MSLACYIHVPFCKSICPYCDFCRILYDPKRVDPWLETIQKEIESALSWIRKQDGLRTLYLGGGTPNILSEDQLQTLVSPLIPYLHEDYEFTIECTPEALNEDKIKAMKKLGVNRVSLGVQSFHDDILRKLGRRHTKEMIERAIESLKRNGIENISIDLMYALPFQDQRDLKKDIEEFLKLDIMHLSIYSLILEENSAFGKAHMQPLDEDLEADEYEWIVKTLKEHGFDHYEISSFAKEGAYSKHNLAYWMDEDFIGIGAGASGRLLGARYHNTKDLDTYIRLGPCRTEEKTDGSFEAIMMGLRTSFGVDLKAYEEKYQIDLEKKAQPLMKKYEGELMIQEGALKCDERGREKLNSILVDFLDLYA